MIDTPQTLLERFSRRDATVAVVGLGYVGLPLAVAFAGAGFPVIGIDHDPARVEAVNRGESFVADVPADVLGSLVARGALRATTEYDVLTGCDAVSICVPTPLNKQRDPDISFIIAAAEAAVLHLHPGMLFVLESTTYPGTTTEILRPILEDNAQGLRIGESIFLAYSPERIDPGREDWTVRTTPRVVGGVTPACLELATALYGQVIDRIVPVSSTEAAETAKLLENTFRAINIGLANEVLLMCDALGLDVWEVIDAASTKPFGFMRFTPGPGLGGHCIPIDPLYLSWRLKNFNCRARFIELATEINTSMPAHWVRKVQDALNDAGKPVKGSAVLVLGISYKRDVPDVRESPAIDIMLQLREKGAIVVYHDPHVPVVDQDGIKECSVPNLQQALAGADCVVVVTDHSAYDWVEVRRLAKLIVDTRNVVPASAEAEPSTESALTL